jgi:ubiquinone/menaquinone biosynthesis C-methylase UbiE
MPLVLDVCCGSRMFWFDKADGRALFVDKRLEDLDVHGHGQISIKPDIVGDFTALPFPDDTFSLVVFDPPHLKSTHGATGIMPKLYGRLAPDFAEQLRRGFAECFRVLKPSGTLVFKWADTYIKARQILTATPEKPLFGSRSGKTAHWYVFLKSASRRSLGGEDS